jgi:Protein of unknown function (DUF3046)
MAGMSGWQQNVMNNGAAYMKGGLLPERIGLRHSARREWGTSTQADRRGPAAPRPSVSRGRAGAGRMEGQYPGRVRLTDFWARMRAQFGDVYAQSVAKDYVFDKLGGRTIERALADGVDAKVVWRAVVDTFDVPQRLR